MKYINEVTWIMACTFIGEALNKLLPLPIPAGVYGLILLLAGLVSGIVKHQDVESAGGFLLDTMTIMFIPAAVGIIDVTDILLPVLVPYLVIIVLSTVIVMTVTGIAASFMLRNSGKKLYKTECSKTHEH